MVKVEPATPAKSPVRMGAAAKACRDELDVMIRARYPIIYVVSWEEERVEQQLARIAAARNKKLFIWTYTQGIVKYGSEPTRGQGRQRLHGRPDGGAGFGAVGH